VDIIVCKGLIKRWKVEIQRAGVKNNRQRIPSYLTDSVICKGLRWGQQLQVMNGTTQVFRIQESEFRIARM